MAVRPRSSAVATEASKHHSSPSVWQYLAGSVGIGGAQTGIYPSLGPGGWNLIGRTDLRLFDPSRTEPILLRPGDLIKFVAVGA